jgi:two-component system sensor histidine kinase BaeS
MLVDNLVVNAVTYSHDGGVVEVTCAPEPEPAGGARLTVRDHGIGIAPEKLPRIFDDYYRTEEAVAHNRASTGLGLAIVRQVARATGATLEVESAPGRGTTFTVIFPGAPLAAESAPNLSAAQPQSQHGLPADR